MNPAPPIRVLRNATLVLPDRCLEGDLLLQEKQILSLARAGEGEGEEIWDLQGRHVAPGLIDLHTHGGWGIDFSHDPVERLVALGEHYARSGVTRLLVTLVPAPEHEMLECLKQAARACQASPVLVGIHLEGPFLARERRGALPEAGILPYDPGLMQRLLKAGGGFLRVMTFAPEAIPLQDLPKIESSGVRLSVGHTCADAATTEAALGAGVTRATHLCNAMPPVHHRSSGPVVPLLLDSRVSVEVIADGFHLEDRFLELILAVKEKGTVVAVSDSIPLAGLAPGEREFAGTVVTSDGRRATRPDGTLAGSVTPLFAALKRVQEQLQLPLEEVWRLGSLAPAQDLGLKGSGRIGSGCHADLLILGESGDVEVTLVGGDRLERDEGEAFLPELFSRVR